MQGPLQRRPRGRWGHGVHQPVPPVVKPLFASCGPHSPTDRHASPRERARFGLALGQQSRRDHAAMRQAAQNRRLFRCFAGAKRRSAPAPRSACHQARAAAQGRAGWPQSASATTIPARWQRRVRSHRKPCGMPCNDVAAGGADIHAGSDHADAASQSRRRVPQVQPAGSRPYGSRLWQLGAVRFPPGMGLGMFCVDIQDRQVGHRARGNANQSPRCRCHKARMAAASVLASRKPCGQAGALLRLQGKVAKPSSASRSA
jgi:hypothetical protein